MPSLNRALKGTDARESGGRSQPHSRWFPVEEYNRRYEVIFTSLAIQLVIEICMDCYTMLIARRIVFVDLRRALRSFATTDNLGTETIKNSFAGAGVSVSRVRTSMLAC